MKVLFALFAIFALALAKEVRKVRLSEQQFSTVIIDDTFQEPEACAVCRKGVDVLMKELNSKDSLAVQEKILIDDGCSKAEDPKGCAEGVKTWWGRMAKAVYTDKAAAKLCQTLEPECADKPKPALFAPSP